ncbi:MAG: prephenate dehydratase [Bacteriovoracaceae bacterium]|nr:prephenate dehydratase [Bacteriovoracaceae bacterium]
MKKIAFQGARGAYSEMASLKFFGHDVNPIGFDQSEQVCDALDESEVDFAVLPVENSIVGNVSVNLDLLYQHNFFAIGEVYLPIHHCLMVNPGTKLENIKTVHSHPIALAQCRDFINRHGIIAHADFDTAGACKLVKERGHEHEGTIASSLCAEVYGLEILEDHIQKVKNNITRFLVFIREEDLSSSYKQEKTSIAFSTKHKPGALLNCLQEFKKFNLNLTKLESRPIPENPFAYIFYVDFIGALQDSKVHECLEALKNDTDIIKILGSYPQGEKAF